MVLFLGDLLDEGSKASDAQFKSYVARFKNIFKTPPHVKVRWELDGGWMGVGWELDSDWMGDGWC